MDWILKRLDLKKAGLEFILKHFGKNGLFFYDISRGIDNRPVQPDRDRKSVGAENTFLRDLIEKQELNEAMTEISDILFERLIKAKVWGRTLTIKIKYHDFQQITRSKSYADTLNKRDDILHQSCELLHQNRQADKSIRLLGISFSHLEPYGSKQGKQLKINFRKSDYQSTFRKTKRGT